MEGAARNLGLGSFRAENDASIIVADYQPIAEEVELVL
jgi:hypothetical protein